MTQPQPAAGWYPDPSGSGVQRYWDGSAWTDHTSGASGAATAQPAQPAQPNPAAGPDVDRARDYLHQLGARLQAAGFELEAGSGDVALRGVRKQVKAARFGVQTTVVTASAYRPSLAAAEAADFSARAFQAALPDVRGIRGLGGSLVFYPLLVVESAPAELRAFVTTEPKKHWAALEFPVIAELASGQLLYYEKTPVWGAAYFKTTRREAAELFAPSATARIAS